MYHISKTKAPHPGARYAHISKTWRVLKDGRMVFNPGETYNAGINAEKREAGASKVKRYSPWACRRVLRNSASRLVLLEARARRRRAV